jgi:ABC-type antimicrobial peptide transport system permease subunit
MPLLTEMSSLQYGVLLLGIVFDVVVILFVTISVLLIYSLLMVSVETKTFENGVLRMIGINTRDCISVIFY